MANMKLSDKEDMRVEVEEILAQFQTETAGQNYYTTEQMDKFTNAICDYFQLWLERSVKETNVLNKEHCTCKHKQGFGAWHIEKGEAICNICRKTIQLHHEQETPKPVPSRDKGSNPPDWCSCNEPERHRRYCQLCNNCNRFLGDRVEGL